MPNNNDNYEYMKFLDLSGVQQIWNTCKQTFVQTVNGVGIDENGNVNVSGGGTSVVANPTLAGTESALTGIEIGTTKYKVNYMEDIIDKDGHKRFVEANGSPMSVTGFTNAYCKWSLSGTHIMFVLAGTFASGSTLPANQTLATFNVPSWIYDKIYPVWSSTIIEKKIITFIDNNWSEATKDCVLQKISSVIRFQNPSSVPLSFSSNKSFRIQFDLMIDDE